MWFQLKTILATENRSRLGIRVTKILARAGDVVDPVKIFLTYSLITMQNLAADFHPVCTHVGGPENLGDVRVPPLRVGRIVDSLETHSPNFWYAWSCRLG